MSGWAPAPTAVVKTFTAQMGEPMRTHINLDFTDIEILNAALSVIQEQYETHGIRHRNHRLARIEHMSDVFGMLLEWKQQGEVKMDISERVSA